LISLSGIGAEIGTIEIPIPIAVEKNWTTEFIFP
jgi:hypothetical protein